MTHCGTQQLETERLLLRRFTLKDVDAMYCNWASDPVVTRYLTWSAHETESVTLTVLKDWVASYVQNDFYQWAIVLK